MSDQPPNKNPGNKSFRDKLKRFFWSKSVTTRVSRLVEIVLIGGGICYVPWLTSDALSPDYPSKRVFLIMSGVFLLLAHIAVSCAKEVLEWKAQIYLTALLIFISLFAYVGWNRHAPASTIPASNLKQELRTFLESIDPEVLAMVDRGEPIAVMLGPANELKLNELAARPEFGKYLAFQKTTHVMMGGTSNHLGTYIEERGAAGLLNGFGLFPKDALKR